MNAWKQVCTCRQEFRSKTYLEEMHQSPQWLSVKIMWVVHMPHCWQSLLDVSSVQVIGLCGGRAALCC